MILLPIGSYYRKEPLGSFNPLDFTLDDTSERFLYQVKDLNLVQLLGRIHTGVWF